MPRIVVIATGGTIASEDAADGRGAVAARTAGDMVDAMDFGGVTVQGHDLLRLGSYLLGHRELRQIAEAVAEHVARPEVDGVVVTHGTDTMEESAYLLDLVHDSPKPVVLTGAQKAADRPDTDGPQNLRDSVAVAAAPRARERGALIVFAGQVYGAQRTRKHHTIAPSPFHTLDGGPLGQVHQGRLSLAAEPVRPPRLPRPDARFDDTRVDVVTVYPGADEALARAAVAAGARGVVLAGTGTGNANHSLVSWTRQAVADGVVVGVSTRVAEGPAIPMYGNGGAVDLVAAGALVMGGLPLYHSRLLLALLLAAGGPVGQEEVGLFTR